MDKWHFYQYLFTHLDTNFLAVVARLSGQMIAALQAPALAAVTLYIAGTTASDIIRPTGEGNVFLTFIRRLIRCVVVLSALTVASYHEIGETFLLNDLPNSLTSAIAGVTATNGAGPAAFDKMSGGAWKAAEQVWKGVSILSAQGVGITIALVLCVGVSQLAIFFAFIIFLASHVTLGLAIAIGGLFILALLWPKTERFFTAWLCACLALIFTQYTVVALLAVVLGFAQDAIKQIGSMNGAAGVNASDEFGQLHLLIEAGLLFFALGYLTKRAEELARHLAGHGFSLVSPIVAAGMGAASRIGGAVVSAASGGIGAATQLSGSAGLRSIRPTPMKAVP